MTWDTTMRKAAWACFGLMWVALAIFIIRHPRDPVLEDMYPVFAFLAFLSAFIILLVLSLVGPLFVTYRESRVVREKGTLVPAVIRDVADTGIYLNKQPVLEIAITVRPPHEAAFEAKVRQVIPFSAIPQLQPGTELDVYYIPGTTRVAMPE
ncbi:MAG: hypothetical protein LUQ35_04675 [Methanoregula sp.]|jgi:hypothetical protein|nr:hypothetical protein [Methanoregula sp.]